LKLETYTERDRDVALRCSRRNGLNKTN